VIAQNVAFWIIAVVMAVAAIRVVTSRNLVHAALYLITVLIGASAQFIILLAEFVGVTQFFLYVGAVAVLFLFGIIVTRAPMQPADYDNDQRWPALAVSLLLLGVLVALLIDAFGHQEIELSDELLAIGRSDAVGNSLFRNFVVPFEVVSMLLLAALIGAVAIARRD
jgi:NADH-quinone oxidoreductase subunit J